MDKVKGLSQNRVGSLISDNQLQRSFGRRVLRGRMVDISIQLLLFKGLLSQRPSVLMCGNDVVLKLLGPNGTLLEEAITLSAKWRISHISIVLHFKVNDIFHRKIGLFFHRD